MKRYAAIVFLWALALRLGIALVTESHAIFPRYCYADAIEQDQAGWRIAQDWRTGRPVQAGVSPGRRIYEFYDASLYWLFGHRTIVPKAVNALFGALAAVCFFHLAALFAPPRRALAFALMIASWPSHVFFSSQNVKDAIDMLLIAWTTYEAILYLELRPQAVPRRAAAAMATLILGLFKSYFLLIWGAATISVYLLRLFLERADARARRTLAAGILWLALPIVSYRPFARFLFTRVMPNAPADNALTTSQVTLLLYRQSEERAQSEPFMSPAGITATRQFRQRMDQVWSRRSMGRAIETQLFPDAVFRSWRDVVFYLPKGLIYVLFMPLPWLYPTAGSLGRTLAAGENMALLLIFTFATIRFLRFAVSGRFSSAWACALVFGIMALASALFELDLGSASRHKLEYLPFALLFAFLPKKAMP